MLKRLLTKRRSAARENPRIPPGERIYAIGDVHGRLDLLDILLDLISADDLERGAARTTLIFLGDLVDRGPHSAGVLDRVMNLDRKRWPNVRLLLGNHEEVFLSALGGKRDAVRAFCRIGGRETLLSYGTDAAEYPMMDYADVATRLATTVPDGHRALMSTMEDIIIVGDYAFVHAGVRPGIGLSQQRTSDLRWIREPFLSQRDPLEKTIVHGHTITDAVFENVVRIGVDTGAYLTGRLSALALQDDKKWVIAGVGESGEYAF